MIRAQHVRMASRYLAHRFSELHPYEVQAVLLNACNLRCVYCTYPEVKTALLGTEQWCTIIRRLGTLGTLRIKFQGGEPTLRKDFRDLCAAAQAAGIHTAAITNGLPVAGRPELLDNLDEVVFSLDAACPETNDRLRGVGTYTQILKAIEIAQQRGLPTYVSMVVSRDTLSDVEPMLDLCERLGVRLTVQPVLFDRKYYDNTARHLALSSDETRQLYRRLADWKRHGRALVFSTQTYSRILEWPDYDVPTMHSRGASTCMAGRYYVHIEANGDVHPCAQHDAAFTPKNLITDGIDEALGHARHHDCGDCAIPYLTERKALFALRPAALLEMVRRS